MLGKLDLDANVNELSSISLSPEHKAALEKIRLIQRDFAIKKFEVKISYLSNIFVDRGDHKRYTVQNTPFG